MHWKIKGTIITLNSCLSGSWKVMHIDTVYDGMFDIENSINSYNSSMEDWWVGYVSSWFMFSCNIVK